MTLQEMYGGMNNSPQTKLTANITAAATTIPVEKASNLPPAPNIATIGIEENAELVLYNGISGNSLTGCIRGFGGTLAQIWLENEPVYRAYTSVDHERFIQNILDINTFASDTAASLPNITIDGGTF